MLTVAAVLEGVGDGPPATERSALGGSLGRMERSGDGDDATPQPASNARSAVAATASDERTACGKAGGRDGTARGDLDGCWRGSGPCYRDRWRGRVDAVLARTTVRGDGPRTAVNR